MFSDDLKKWRIFNTLQPEFMSKVYMAVVYGDIGDNALIVTNDKMVYAIGTNTNGCLGTGDTASTLDPIEVKELCRINIKSFACGQNHVLALTKEGLVYSWGYNKYNNREYGHFRNQIKVYNSCLTPTLLKELSTTFIVNIASGSYHSLALTNKGKVYVWEHATASGNTFKQMNSELINKSIISITCGNAFSMVVTEKGEVYGWGENSVGQLGIGDTFNRKDPCRVAALDNIVIEKVICGYTHTLALSVLGVLYVWGENNYGQLGLGETVNVLKPVKLTMRELGKIWDIAASYRSHISAALGEGNQVYIWGQCLGQSITVPIITLLGCLDDAFSYYAWPRVTYQPLIFYTGKSSNLKNSLNKAFDDPTTSDLIIKVQETPIYVHKAVLKIRCEHFRTMFQNFWVENNGSVIQLESFSYNVYKSFLKYLYTDKIDVSSLDALVELLDIASMYLMSQLKRRCVEMLTQILTVENIAFLYSISFKYNVKELEKYCFKFALNHMTAVVQTPGFVELDKTILNKFLIKAAQAGAFKT